MSDQTFRCLIMGAAGRDFHNFQTFFRDHPQFYVCAFTATQIPFIASRPFPRELAGPQYAHDIPIFPEEQLPELIDRYRADFVFLAYSDLSHADVMHKASLVLACGSSFALLGPRHTQLVSHRPVISVTATRTGAGKSPVTQWLAGKLQSSGHSVGIVRHPMPYGNLRAQALECFRSTADLDHYECTIEEREEYEPYLEAGLTIYSGVDYRSILARAEVDSTVILWDGGNNDFSFFRPTLSIVVADALRPGHELAYYPGETNFRSADILIFNKIATATAEGIRQLRHNAATLNPGAVVIDSSLEIETADSAKIRGRRVLVVEDGPTLTHGGMGFGAGFLAAREAGALEIIDPRPFAQGTIATAFREFPHLQRVLPALGYSPEQRHELAETIRSAAPEVIVDASPARLDRILSLTIPVVRVRYRFSQSGGPDLWELVLRHLSQPPQP